ncbi:hypothetical protein BU25DRAFT_87516 [Macroventuria anomochaeta]|uniref:Uncharacterized protein n=1 Tax=Macroventuria anomochaeta TaxID=301207 RepID=A0ACB6SHQ0_9PLEO|nr:uncharacterized protein BU25DRAFT_87516 [Macroventuria anomochaeta]KAF2633012.1 hypothetical protein BU25DRAFT_87516 [Macroventuria anomochaeta]
MSRDRSAVRTFGALHLQIYRAFDQTRYQQNYLSSRPAGSDQNLCSVGYAVDRSVNAVKRPFGNTPLSARQFRSFLRYRRAREKVRLKEIILLSSRDHLNVGACMPGAP